MTELEIAQERIKQLESDLSHYIELEKLRTTLPTSNVARASVLDEAKALIDRVYESYEEVPKNIEALFWKICDCNDPLGDRPLEKLTRKILLSK